MWRVYIRVYVYIYVRVCVYAFVFLLLSYLLHILGKRRAPPDSSVARSRNPEVWALYRRVGRVVVWSMRLGALGGGRQAFPTTLEQRGLRSGDAGHLDGKTRADARTDFRPDERVL